MFEIRKMRAYALSWTIWEIRLFSKLYVEIERGLPLRVAGKKLTEFVFDTIPTIVTALIPHKGTAAVAKQIERHKK